MKDTCGIERKREQKKEFDFLRRFSPGSLTPTTLHFGGRLASTPVSSSIRLVVDIRLQTPLWFFSKTTATPASLGLSWSVELFGGTDSRIFSGGISEVTKVGAMVCLRRVPAKHVRFVYSGESFGLWTKKRVQTTGVSYFRWGRFPGEIGSRWFGLPGSVCVTRALSVWKLQHVVAYMFGLDV
ncbi:Uncharacterized protein Rs2_10765 [Raphanus sativus]|nr:hypothetical protein Rs2_46506 [Raphanus sativus]KAJ4907107.1 Uncharacterized protein Rs2_10765 [Raphanus sativus]